MKDKTVKKTQAIRDALTKAGRPMSLDEIRNAVETRMKQIINKQKLYTLLSVMQVDKELGTVGRGEDRFYHLIRRKVAA